MKDCVLSPLSFLSLLLLSGVLSACPAEKENHPNARPHEVVVSAVDDFGIPCSIDLSGVLTQEKMQRFHPEVQHLLYRAERIACRFYDRLVQEKPKSYDKDTMDAFERKYMGWQDFKKLQNAYKSPQERRLAAADFVEVVKLSLEHHFPGHGQCIEDTVNTLKFAFESKSNDKADLALMEFANERKSCARWPSSNGIEKRFFLYAMSAFWEGFISSNKNLPGFASRNEL